MIPFRAIVKLVDMFNPMVRYVWNDLSVRVEVQGSCKIDESLKDTFRVIGFSTATSVTGKWGLEREWDHQSIPTHSSNLLAPLTSNIEEWHIGDRTVWLRSFG